MITPKATNRSNGLLELPPFKEIPQPSITLVIIINMKLRLPTKPYNHCWSKVENYYPDQNNQNPDCNKYGLQIILEQSGNTLFG